MPANVHYVSSDTARFDVFAGSLPSGEPRLVRQELLWGDRVRRLGPGRSATEWRVRARGRTGYVARAALGGDPLLEVYFIDVGQGDGILICTPERRHILIDGGWPRRGQPTGKNAADFVDWKFAKDYEMDRIDLDAVMCSHNDQDHYGGLWDLFNPEEEHELDIPTSRVTAERFYHAGLSWWRENGRRTLGRTVETPLGRMHTQLIDSRNSVLDGLRAGADPALQGEWADFLETMTKVRTRAGTLTPMQRLGHSAGYVPGFAPGDGDVAIRVLAPVEFDVDGRTGIRYYAGGSSKNTNGNSLLLRLDYGRSRVLLTGDLNTKSMRALLDDWTGERQEFQCDVAKACHHGSDDVSYDFLAAMRPAVTIISSGDNEGHDHPRPGVIAASATTGYLSIEDDRIVSPLIYSTELARSVRIGKLTALEVPDNGGSRKLSAAEFARTRAELAVTMAGDRRPSSRTRNARGSYVVAGTVYGLVNVRTDGERILCATLNEAGYRWQVKTLSSRF